MQTQAILVGQSRGMLACNITSSSPATVDPGFAFAKSCVGFACPDFPAEGSTRGFSFVVGACAWCTVLGALGQVGDISRFELAFF